MILLSSEGYNVADITRLTFFEDDSMQSEPGKVVRVPMAKGVEVYLPRVVR